SLYLSIYGPRHGMCHGLRHIGEDSIPVGATEERLDAALGVRHEPEDVARLVPDPRDVRDRAIRIRLERRRALRVDVAEHDAPGRLELGDRVGVRDEAALAVTDRHAQHLAR